MKKIVNQEKYIVRKLKEVKRKLYQAYLIPFFVDFAFRMGAAVLGDNVGVRNATIISISLLTLTRIKAIKDLVDVVKGLIETEKIEDPSITFKKVIIRDIKKYKKIILNKKNKSRDSSRNNIFSIIVGAVAPMTFDYFSMGIVAKYGAGAAGITQIIDTLLHLSSLLILFSSVKKIKIELNTFDENYYEDYKTFIHNSLSNNKPNIISKIIDNIKIRSLLKKENTSYYKEKIRRFLVDSNNLKKVINDSIESHEWEQFYLQFPNEKDYAERSIRKCDDKYMIITKIIEKDSYNNKYGYADSSRDTYSFEIEEEKYNEFKKINGKNPIYKLTTYSIKNGNNTILLDVYKDDYEGLNIARVKFKDTKESSIFIEPEWFDKEITYDPDYTGKHFKYPTK